MKLLLDTHLLLWTVGLSGLQRELPAEALSLVEGADQVYFSVASVWEVAIKHATGRPEFQVDPRLFRRALMEAGYRELLITGEHAAEVASLPRLHKDPFDRLLVAQAGVEGVTLLTVDETLARYPGPVRRV